MSSTPNNSNNNNNNSTSSTTPLSTNTNATSTTSNTPIPKPTSTAATNTNTTTTTTTTTSSTHKPSSSSSSNVSTKPVHPLTLTSFAPTGCELSCWAYLTIPRPTTTTSSNSNHTTTPSSPTLPNLVTAHANSLRIYVVDPTTGTLILASSYDCLAGTVVTLHALPRAAGRTETIPTVAADGTGNGGRNNGVVRTRELVYDGLLLGFAGHPRLSVVYPPGSGIVDDWDSHHPPQHPPHRPTVSSFGPTDNHTNPESFDATSWNGVLTASSIIDLSLPLVERCRGSVTPLEQDLICAVSVSNPTETAQLDDDDDPDQTPHSGGEGGSGWGDVPTVAVVLGGGVAVAAFQLPRTAVVATSSSWASSLEGNGGGGGTARTKHHNRAWWRIASDPYLLPLSTLACGLATAQRSLPSLSMSGRTGTDTKRKDTVPTPNTTIPSTAASSTFCHGFGDIYSVTILPHYTEPVLILLHSNPNRHGGAAWSGRLAHRSSSTRCPMGLTAVQVGIGQRRGVVLWTLRDGLPSDATTVVVHHGSCRGSGSSSSGKKRNGGGRRRRKRNVGGVLVMGANEVVYVCSAGRIRCALGVNGWVRGTGSSVLMPRRTASAMGGMGGGGGGGLLQPNPSPLGKLSVQLDGSHTGFVSDNVALVSTRDGTLYSLELHTSNDYGSGSDDVGGGSCSGSRNNKRTRKRNGVGFVGGGFGDDGGGGGGGGMCLSLSPVRFRLGGVGAVSTLSVLQLLSVPSFRSEKMVGIGDGDHHRIGTTCTKEDDDGDSGGGGGGDVFKKIGDGPPTSLGLVFAGSRLGDSTLMMYGLHEGVELEPLVEEQKSDVEEKKAAKEVAVEKDSVTTAASLPVGADAKEGEDCKTDKVETPNVNEKTDMVPTKDEDNEDGADDDGPEQKRPKIKGEPTHDNMSDPIATVPMKQEDEAIEPHDATATPLSEVPSEKSNASNVHDPPQPTTTTTTTTVTVIEKDESMGVTAVSDDDDQHQHQNEGVSEEEILRQEEEALYAPVSDDDDDGYGTSFHGTTTTTTTVTDYSASDDNDESALLPGVSVKLLARPQITSLSIFRGFKVLDSLTGLGPVGPGCVGAITSDLTRIGLEEEEEKEKKENVSKLQDDEDEDQLTIGGVGGARTNIHPCGYGSSGGLAILTAPGVGYGGSISNEVDCRNVENVFSFERLGYVMMTNKSRSIGVGKEDEKGKGCILLKLVAVNDDDDDRSGGNGERKKKEKQLEEIDIDTFVTTSPYDVVKMEEGSSVKNETNKDEPPSFSDLKDILTCMTILTAKEFSITADLSGPHILMIVSSGTETAIVILSCVWEESGQMEGMFVAHSHRITSCSVYDKEECGPKTATRGSLISVSISEPLYDTIEIKEPPSLTCVWSCGRGSVFTISQSESGMHEWLVKEIMLQGTKEVNEGGGKVDSFTVTGRTNDDDDDDDVEGFYRSERIVAMDVFTIADNVFSKDAKDMPNGDGPRKTKMGDSNMADDTYNTTSEMNTEEGENNNDVDDASDLELYGDEVDVDDLELYGEEAADEVRNAEGRMATTRRTKENRRTKLPSSSFSSSVVPSRFNALAGYVSGAGLSPTNTEVVAVCRQNGRLEIYDVSSLVSLLSDRISSSNIITDADSTPTTTVVEVTTEEASHSLLWMAKGGCGSGAPILAHTNLPVCNPRMHRVCAREIRAFFSGPSIKTGSTVTDGDLSMLRSLCLLVETTSGDLHLYIGSISPTVNALAFRRFSYNTPTRTSKLETRHHSKLRSRGILPRTGTASTSTTIMYRKNHLHRFLQLSGQDGLFAATARPLWFVSERGAPVVLCHRLRHAAPAGVNGGGESPVNGFCAGLLLEEETSGENSGGSKAFLTLHDRIGRIGSQRLTLFNGLSDVFAPHGILPGGGICVQKVPFGVTVRHVKFIDDASVSSPIHPLYALLISRETQNDQSHLNDDGMTSDERRGAKEEKEREKTRRQVEADLGGFEVEQEWVEEIEREDCFEVEKKYGGAPPIPGREYEIWLVDALGWKVIDTYPLNEWEHGLAIEVMYLSDITEDPNGDKTPKDIGRQLDNSLFLTVGTGIVDQDGEDVSSRGRVLLFEIKRTAADSSSSGNSSSSSYHRGVARINFIYEKDILLGPVTALVCLPCENKNRLVVGAGAELTVEQWGANKLTQVGFFHANMQVQSITLFKTFLLLSDAYDSLHFLVWRESDKSLTLLAKDYEPTCVYAAGLITRGGAVSFVCHDDRQNLAFFGYAPNDPAARGGNRLVRRADYHLGAQTVALQSHYCRSSLLVNSATVRSTTVALELQDPSFGRSEDDRRFALHFGTTDGGFGTVLPLNENVYWRLLALQSVMSNALESDCSLSQRAWRLYRRTPRRGGCKSNDRKKGVIDGDLVMRYTDLALTDQEDLASAIGSTVDLVLDNLLEVACSSMVI